MSTFILVRGDFGYHKTSVQGLDSHFLLDRGNVLDEVESPCRRSPDGAETILCVCKADTKTVVETQCDNVAAHHPKEL